MSAIINIPVDNPLNMLKLWHSSTDIQKEQLKTEYITKWYNTHDYIPDVFSELPYKTKDTHWLYWWKTIGLMEDKRYIILIDKWMNAILKARDIKDVVVEKMLLRHIFYWIWPEDEDLFFTKLAEVLVTDYQHHKETYNNGPFEYNTVYPGIGIAKSIWKDMINYLILETYPRPGKYHSQKLQAQLWITVNAYNQSDGELTRTTPNNLTWFKNHPDLWPNIIKHQLSVNRILKIIDSTNN